MREQTKILPLQSYKTKICLTQSSEKAECSHERIFTRMLDGVTCGSRFGCRMICFILMYIILAFQ